MAKIRDDLVGAIHAARGVVLMAGDAVPSGVVVHDSRLAPEPRKRAAAAEDAPAPKPKRRAPRKKADDAVTVD